MSDEFKPSGYPSVSPYLIVRDAEKTLAFLADVFGAERLRVIPEGVTRASGDAVGADRSWAQWVDPTSRSHDGPASGRGRRDRRGELLEAMLLEPARRFRALAQRPGEFRDPGYVTLGRRLGASVRACESA